MDWALMILLISSLLNVTQSIEIDTTQEIQEKQEVVINSTESTTSQRHENVADAVNDFGYKLLLTMMKQNKDQNIVISPTSIAGLLSMTLLGTVGKTYEELAGALGMSADILRNRKNHEQFGDLLQSLNDTTSKTMYADALFVDSSSRLREMYRSFLSRVYNGEAVSVDFHKPEEAKDVINHWVDAHTEGKIEDFLKKSLPVETKAVLMSALYFRGQWKNVFLDAYTEKMRFKTPSKEIMADLMLNMGNFNYTYSLENELHMIALPYNDSVTTMYALKPRVSRQSMLTLHELMTRLDSTKINAIIDQMQYSKCVIRFPKMDLKISTKLEEPLKALGVETLFQPGQANFALMVETGVPNKTETEIISRIHEDGDARGRNILENLPNPGLHVDSVIHDVKLTINEYGTEAAAATSGVLGRTANLFYADSPFYMFIRNEKTKLVTFSAIINDPTL